MTREPVIVAGFGCRAGATTEAFAAALAACDATPDALAVPEDRAPLLAGLATLLDLPILPLPPHRLAAVDTITRSPVSLATRGVGSVAEAAALAAAGPDARLIVTRRLSPDRAATCAIATSRHCFATLAMKTDLQGFIA